MKSIFSLFAGLLVSFTCLAQINEGSISYKVDFVINGSEQEAMASMMAGSQMTMHYKDGSTRVEVAMGTMMKMVTVSSLNSDKVLLLMDIPMANMKYAVLTDVKTTEETPITKMPKLDIRHVNETKEILGYSCKKAILTDESGLEYVFWYTDGITAHKGGQSYLNYGVPGFPLEYEIFQSGFRMKMTATSLETKIDPTKSQSLFLMEVPAGYEVKDLKDLNAMGGGR
ncbi:MAG: hypothetical protein A3D92_09710 [Bacteroidetes bacterium RIFCSPHIGHO2_02_FULL_44_7]|nr:MAG: hypothetical protein A3D92_09710 [Bacteroidetes bacterium RIFCSPHIGHO2_02_FULL_44_7]